MNKAEQFFETLVNHFATQADVTEGKMMSSRGLQYKGKNFLFNWDNEMCFRLGRDFDPASEGIHHYTLLNPFKTKLPLKDWFVLTTDMDKWIALAEIALARMKSGR
ncbi:hypothetical protein [Roseivirga sp. UBA838]|uniref:hypothetical protein n=1 Tax=Roseivirga sp. UBA838 TaxID=1947393 RepID=UPI00257FEB73|nr:hypothetical protein [Roseivirga sp. UBA838]|tara:strand:+ start:30087 stop:30404 length:318 start_codon:yes stop_codon:yes gene_type:complete